jgi:heavy metal sensor kinase
MFLKKGIKSFRTVTFRLTIWYAILFSSVSLLVFGIIYITLMTNLSKRMDALLVKQVNGVELLYRMSGREMLGNQFIQEAKSVGTRRVFLRLIGPDGKVIETSDMSRWKDVQVNREVRDLPIGKEIIRTLRLEHGYPVRVISKKIFDGNIIQIGNTQHEDEELIEAYREVSLTVIMVFLLCGGLVGWFMARRAMSGVERVTQTAVNIGKADLTSRVPLGNEGEEINNLAQAFNDMLARIQELFTELKDVTNNIAHDLRSPITRMRGLAETTLTGEQEINAYREMAGVVIEESDRLVEMINIMLEIAMTESGVQDTAKREVDLGRLVRNAGDLFQVLAEDKEVGLRIKTPQKPAMVQGNLSQLQRMIGNLLDNAIKFTPKGGRINLTVDSSPTHLIVSVNDTGIGIAEQDLPRIFERFYRGDWSRSTSGNGLGLSHVLAIVRAHGGEISVESTPGKGSSFTVTIPRTAPPGNLSPA